MTPPSSPTAPFTLTTRTISTKEALREGDTVTLELTVESSESVDAPRGMVTAVVGVAAGLELSMSSLRDGVRSGDFDQFELESGGKLVLYWRQLNSATRARFTATASIPGSYAGEASRVYPYYAADEKHWVEGMRVVIVGRGTSRDTPA